MCLGGSGMADPKAPVVATPADPQVTAALDAERKRRMQASGIKSTIVTGGAGLTAPARTAPATLVGG